MDIALIQRFFFWGAIANYGIVLVWFGSFVLGRNRMHSFHGRWFKLTPEQFDLIHYSGIAVYKILILVFFLIPWIVLALIS